MSYKRSRRNKRGGAGSHDRFKRTPEQRRTFKPANTVVAGRVTWRQLVAAQPKLLEVFKEISQIKDEGGPRFCANDVWYGNNGWPGFRERIIGLVGWEAEKRSPSFLTSNDAYDVAYKKCYDALPNCRNCCCM